MLPIVEYNVQPDSMVYTYTSRSYNALDVSGFHHMRINQSELFADHTNHINGIKNFWNQATLKPFYACLKERKEKPLIELVATQRKLLLLIYALWKKEEYYDPDILKKEAASPKVLAVQDSNLIEQLTS